MNLVRSEHMCVECCFTPVFEKGKVCLACRTAIANQLPRPSRGADRLLRTNIANAEQIRAEHVARFGDDPCQPIEPFDEFTGGYATPGDVGRDMAI